MYGLLKRDMAYILEAVKKHPEIEEVILFGSRAMGNCKNGSDVDLALIGDQIDQQTIRKITDDLNEVYPLPYHFDIVNYHDISNEALKEHILKTLSARTHQSRRGGKTADPYQL